MVVYYHIPRNFIISTRIFTSFYLLGIYGYGAKNIQFVETTLYIRQARLTSIEIRVVKNFAKSLGCLKVRKFLVIPII